MTAVTDEQDAAAARLAPALLRAAYTAYPTGVTVLAARAGDRAVARAAASFTSVSLDPPLVSVNLARASSTWPSLLRAGRLGVSVLADDQADLARRFAGDGPDHDTDHLAGVGVTADPSGAVFVDGACLWLGCTVFAEHPAGDHVITVLEVRELASFPERTPLVFHSSEFRQLDFRTDSSTTERNASDS